jgi:hypothetical protein
MARCFREPLRLVAVMSCHCNVMRQSDSDGVSHTSRSRNQRSPAAAPSNARRRSCLSWRSFKVSSIFLSSARIAFRSVSVISEERSLHALQRALSRPHRRQPEAGTEFNASRGCGPIKSARQLANTGPLAAPFPSGGHGFFGPEPSRGRTFRQKGVTVPSRGTHVNAHAKWRAPDGSNAAGRAPLVVASCLAAWSSRIMQVDQFATHRE